MGKNATELFEQFSRYAGFVGTLHTRDGEQSLYSIVLNRDPIYANDTGALFKAYKAAHHEVDGIFYINELHYIECTVTGKHRS